MVIFMRILIVGLNPGKPSKNSKTALSRLTNWLDLLNIQYVSFTNLSQDPNWDFDLKKINKEFLKVQLEGYDKVIALGGLVSNYLHKYLKVDHFKMPHPSYKNRALNDHEYELMMITECKNYLRH
jgi:hypothetical protein